MDSIRRDLDFAIRSLARAPGVSLAAIACLALGIGATTTVYTATRALVLSPVPARQVERLVNVAEVPPNAPPDVDGASPATFLDWSANVRAFAGVAASEWWEASLTGDVEARRVVVSRVSPNFFDVLGVRPLHGRTFRPDEGAPGAPAAVILSHALWTGAFGSEPAVVGRVVRLDGEPYAIAGVMPEHTVYPAGAEVWAPLVLAGAVAQNRRGNWLRVFARLAPGATVEAAAAEVAAIQTRIERDHADVRADWTSRVVPLNAFAGRGPRPFLLLLLAATGLVLLIACVNVANLLLARGTARAREIALRTTLGAGRGRILQQLLTESIVLALAGAFAGLLLALWGVLLFRTAIPAELQQFNPGWTRIRVDGTALLFTTAVAVGTGILFGLFPALQAVRPAGHTALREGGRGATGGRRGRRLREALVVAEVALALVLVLATGVMLKSLAGLLHSDPGFRAEHALAAELSLPAARYPTAAERAAFYDRLLAELRAGPGVRAAGVTSVVPMAWFDTRTRIHVHGREDLREGDLPVVRGRIVSSGLFETLEVALLRGRGFDRADASDSPPVVIVSDVLARRVWPGEDAIGRRVRVIGDTVWREVVGVVADVRHNPNSSGGLVEPTLYRPHAQASVPGMTLVVRATGEPAAAGAVVRAAIARLDADLAAGPVRTLEAVLRDAVSPQRVTVVLLGVFAAIALVLSMVGTFGVLSYAVRQRADEIGVCMALGARPGDVARLVLRQGLRLVCAGIGLGLLGAAALGGALDRLLYDVAPRDPGTFGLGAAVLLAVGALASLLPAARATRHDPARLLRHE